jgi:hypothetical protein
MRKAAFALGVLASVSSTAFAGSYIGMAKPYFFGTTLYIIITGTQMEARPACATRNLVILQESDYNSAQFKSKFAILLSSWLAGQPVYLQGTGSCSSEGDEIIYVVAPA